jgi:hypothetical protein
MNAICFGVYGNVHRRLNNPDSIQSIGIAGMAAGFVMVRRGPRVDTRRQGSLHGHLILTDCS